MDRRILAWQLAYSRSIFVEIQYRHRPETRSGPAKPSPSMSLVDYSVCYLLTGTLVHLEQAAKNAAKGLRTFGNGIFRKISFSSSRRMAMEWASQRIPLTDTEYGRCTLWRFGGQKPIWANTSHILTRSVNTIRPTVSETEHQPAVPPRLCSTDS